MDKDIFFKKANMPPPLDPGFRPPIYAQALYQQLIEEAGAPERLVIGLERENGLFSRYEMQAAKPGVGNLAAILHYVERTVKFLLWARGGFRVYIGGPREIGQYIRTTYSRSGKRSFDVELMERIYEQPFEVQVCTADEVPPEHEGDTAVGGHTDGCRIGFDLGASDYKVAAVQDGQPLYSDEFPWNPRDQRDWRYHFEHIQNGLKKAAEHLPRVDAVGGSSAGVYIDDRPMVASLFRSVPHEDFKQYVQPMFKRIGQDWGVPLHIINDGDVTALAGALSLKKPGMLGMAMGSSEAVGFLNKQGRITGRLNELAFAPCDFNPAGAKDEWSGDGGVGAMYFNQQAVNRLAPAAEISFDQCTPLPERLREVQHLMANNDPRARKIFESIGVYLGYTIPYYRLFYAYDDLLILGRVTSGEGGGIILDTARNILDKEFEALSRQIALHVPDEKSKRVGQAVAAASLPMLRT